MLLQFGALGVTMSWDEGFLGARASRPHKAWHSLGHLPHLDQPRTAPWLSFGLADAVPTHRVAACSIARKFSGGQRDRMRAGRPRSQAPQDGADHSRVKQRPQRCQQRPQRCQQRPQRCPCVVEGCYSFAAYAAAVVRVSHDPGLTPGATCGRGYAALLEDL